MKKKNEKNEEKKYQKDWINAEWPSIGLSNVLFRNTTQWECGVLHNISENHYWNIIMKIKWVYNDKG
jgi:hypothetical protein